MRSGHLASLPPGSLAGDLRGGGKTPCWMVTAEEAEAAQPFEHEPKPGHRRNVWNINISSWYSHGEALLEEATRCNVHAICVSESNLTTTSFRGAAAMASRMGWHIRGTPKPAKGRGGTLLCVREPASLSGITHFRSEAGQLTQATVEGWGQPITLLAFYRRQPHDSTFNAESQRSLGALRGRPWIAAGDWNQPVMEEEALITWDSVGGSIIACSGHIRSPSPIDGVWCSGEVQPQRCFSTVI